MALRTELHAKGSAVRRSFRSLAATVLSGLVLLQAAAMLGLPGPFTLPTARAGGGLTACTTAQLKPEIADIAVNQGLNYPILNRGKRTIVRVFFRLPSTCAVGNKTSITMSGVHVTLATMSGTTTLGTVTLNATASGNLQATAQADAATDPIFRVDASFLAPNPGGSGAAFSLSVSAVKVDFSVSGGATQSNVTPATTSVVLPKAVAFEPRTNALRILVVPMGLTDGTRLSTPGNDTLVAAMGDLARMAPVPDLVGTLATTGGVRYDVGPASLNLTKVPKPDGTTYDATDAATGLFCGKAASFQYIGPALNNLLNAYNAATPSAPADRVLGVVEAAASLGTSSSCDEGRAGVPSGAYSIAEWIRLVPGTPSISGAVLAMEVLHTVGGCVTDPAAPTRCPGNGYHSGTTTDFSNSRGYNLDSLKYLSAPPTVMQLGTNYTTWNGSTTLYEVPDYLLFSCVMTPSFIVPTGFTVPGCDTAHSGTGVAVGGTGTGNGVPAGPRFFINGLTDGKGTAATCPATRTQSNPVGNARYTAPGTTIYGSFTTFIGASTVPTAPAPTSPFRLRYLAAGQLLDDPAGVGVPASHLTGDGDHGSTTGEATDWNVAATLDFNDAADQVELVYNAANPADRSADVVLYCVNKLTAPRLQAGTVVGPSRVAFEKLVGGVWNMYTTALDGTDERQLTANSVAGTTLTQPVWSPDGSALAYLEVVGTSRKVHIINADGTADHRVPGITTSFPVSWTPDGQGLLVTPDGPGGVPGTGTTVSIVDPDAGGAGLPFSLPTAIAGVVMSPDGRFILGHDPVTFEAKVAFMPWSGVVVNPGTSWTTIALPGGAGAIDAAWAPDGRHVAFGTDAAQVALVGADWPSAGLPFFHGEQLVGELEGRSPSFSPDGSTLFYIEGDLGDNPGLHSLDVAAPASDRLLLPGVLKFGTSVSIVTPAHRIAAVCAGGTAICIEDANGGGQHQVTAGQPSYSGVTWSPDGSLLGLTAPSSVGGSAPGLYTMRPDGSGVTRLVAMDQAAAPAWSPNGKWIAFSSGSSTFIVPAGGGAIAASLPGLWNPRWAPDSAHLVGNLGNGLGFARWNGTSLVGYGGLWCASGPASVTCGSTAQLASPDWSPDGAWVLAIRAGLGAQLERTQMSAAADPLPAGSFTPLGLAVGSPPTFTTPRFLPDSDHFLVSASRPNQLGAPNGGIGVWVASLSAVGSDAAMLPSISLEQQTYATWAPDATPANQVSVVSDVPSDVTLTVYYQCPNGQSYPVEVGITPDQLAAHSATFYGGFDAASVCGGAPGTLLTQANDGFLVSNTVSLGAFSPGAKTPQSTILLPAAGAVLDAHRHVVLEGGVTTPEAGPFTLAWTVASGGGAPVAAGSGEHVDLIGSTIPAAFRRADGSWAPGTYTATLRVTDGGGRHSASHVTFTIVSPPTVSVTGVVDGGRYALGGLASTPAAPVPGCATSDTGGGVGAEATASMTPSGVASTALGTHTVTCVGATDGGGHAVPPVAATYVVLAIPTVPVAGVVAGGTYTLGSVPASCVAQTGPGLAPVGIAPTLEVSGGSPNGTGVVTARCTGGTTGAPNGDPVPLPASPAVTYTVLFPAGAFLAPLATRTAVRVSPNATIPLRIRFAALPGVVLDPRAWRVLGVPVACAAPHAPIGPAVPAATPGARPGFRAVGSGVYLDTVSLPAPAVGSCWRLVVRLDDGHTVLASPPLEVIGPAGP